MKATRDNAVEGAPASDPIRVQETPVSDPISIQGTPEIDIVPIQETPASDSIPIEGTPQNEIIPKSDEVEMQLEALREFNPEQQQTIPQETPNADDEELFVIQEPPQRRIHRTPHLTYAEIRESVKIGLDDSGAGKIPRSGLPGVSLRPNINDNNKGKGRKRSRANDVDVSTLGGTDLIADAQANFGKPSIPISTQGNKQSALKEMVASLPPDARNAAIFDKQLVIDATKKFTRRPRPDKKGGWKHVNLKTSLYHHQVLGAAFMREREKSKEQPTGGMLCDVMGLGKTIQTLANIVDDSEDLEDNANTTLIVAPRGLIDHWRTQIENHVQGNVLNPILCHYAGSRNDSDDLELFLRSKIILTSYDEIRISYPIKLKDKPDMPPEQLLRWGMELFRKYAGPLHQIRFRRIILDEGQQIRNPEAQTSIAVRALHGHYKWILSGTPLLNHSAEFWAYFKFLGVPNIGRFSSFVSNFCNGSDVSNQRLVNIVQKIVFRRTHRSRLFSCPIITLPDLNEKTVLVKPFAIEQALYKMLVTSFIDQLNSLASQEDEQSRCFLTMLLKLRMLNSHLLCVQERLKMILDDDKNMAILQSAVADSTNDEANINRDIYVRLEELMHATKQAKRSAKKRILSPENMFREFEDTVATEDDYSDDVTHWMAAAGHEMPSSKVLKTRDVIREWFKDAPDTKLVIFTQFRAMTHIFYHMCKKEGWACTLLTGDMKFPCRTQSLADFQTRPEIKILIASLKVGGTGLDITAANKCILVEPWWNDAIQQQAFCRLFRIGQERDVEIVKLVAKKTIDDYMMDLQKMKLKEIEGAIGDATLPSTGIEGHLIEYFGTPEHLPDGGIMLHPHIQE